MQPTPDPASGDRRPWQGLPGADSSAGHALSHPQSVDLSVERAEAESQSALVDADGGELDRANVPQKPVWRRRPHATLRSGTLGTGSILFFILVAAAAVRFTGLNWDDGQHLHPDERFITMVADRIRFPSGVDEYFDTPRSPANPYNKDFGSYVYGTFPLFFVRGVTEAIQAFATTALPTTGSLGEFFKGWRTAASYGEITLVGRALSGIADLLTIVFVFLIGVRLYGRAVGLLAALLAAFTVLQIQAAHFFTAEGPVTLLLTAAFYLALRASQTIAVRWWALLGVVVGLAVASKITALMIGAVVLTAVWVLWYRSRQAEETAPSRRFILEDMVTSLVVVGAVAALTFRVAQPYAFAGPGFFGIAPNPKYLADLETWQRFATGQADYPPSHQWAGATPYLWQLSNMVLWGMGPPLAVVAWLGFLLATFQFLRNPRQHHLQALAVVWVGLNFLYWGVQFAKPMRYLLPIYPQLTIFAAFFVISAWRWARPGPGLRPIASLRRGAAGALTIGVVGWTVFYAVAFTTIYTRPTTRVTASEWVYDNVPRGSKIGWEHWDDGVPLRLRGLDAATIYPGVEFPMYAEDIEEKRKLLPPKLDEADYIILSSNRLYGSIPKLPVRFPMTTRYYEALFAGELGFERVAEFTSRPSLFGIELNDDNAEEIFTVYEHPKVTIFKKSSTYSSERVRAILESVPIENAVRNLRPVLVRTGGLLLNPSEATDAQAGGTWTAMFDRDSLANALPLLVWYLAVLVLGFVALPLVWYICRRLADGGYALAKTVALLVIAYVPWLLGSLHLLPYDRLSILVAVVLLAAGSLVVLARHLPAFLGEMAARTRAIVAMEILFGAGFLGFAALRAANPDLWHSGYGGEKPMDFAYLNAIIKTTWFPPYDPWLAGGYINYYYFGHVIVASLTKLTGIVPWVAYNLAIPTIAALTMTGVASAVYNILISRPGPARRELWVLGGATTAALLAVVGGNLHEVVMLAEWLGRQVSGQGAPFDLANSRWFWNATRVITTDEPHAITEFPFFTFLYGDLHAHMIAMPFGLLLVGLALNIVHQHDWLPSGGALSLRGAARQWAGAVLSPGGLTLILASVTVAVVQMTNSWDFPTYLGLISVAIFLGEATRRRPSWGTVLVRTVALAGLVAIMSQIFVSPYANRFALFYTGFEISRFHTGILHYAIILGAFLSVVVTYLVFRFMGLRARFAQGGLGALALVGAPPASSIVAADASATPLPRVNWDPAAGFAVIVGAVTLFVVPLAALAGVPVVGVALAGIVALGILSLLSRPSPSMLFTFVLVATALAITAGVEIITLKGDIGRMNTVFKFYLQAWLFLAIATGVLLTLLARRAWGSRWLLKPWRQVLSITLGIILGATFIYTALGTPSKLQHRFVHLPPSLDGMEFMSVARYQDKDRDLALPDDYRAINWMLDNIQGSPVIVEGLAPLYHWRSRVANFTGLPTVLGWDWHQKQQRGDFGYMVDDRVKDVDELFTTTSPDVVRRLLDKYGVSYVYVGGQERAFYPPQGIEKFERMEGSALERVYKNDTVAIYRVRR